MSLAETTTNVEYPESDGEPMGETDLHIDWMFRLRSMLKYRYRNQRVYVACDLLLYFKEGEPQRCVSPDVFVVKNCDPAFRRVYKLWEEGQPPHVAMEVTSRDTRREDEVFKPKTYADIGIAEYFLYDPTSDYLRPALQGHRLAGESYERIVPDAQGRLLCEQLGLWLTLQDRELAIYDVQSGAQLLTAEDAQGAALEAERAAREAAEAELERLREELRRSKDTQA